MMIQTMNAIIRLMMIATTVSTADGTSVQNMIQPHDMSIQFVSFSIVNTRNKHLEIRYRQCSEGREVFSEFCQNL